MKPESLVHLIKSVEGKSEAELGGVLGMIPESMQALSQPNLTLFNPIQRYAL